MAELLPYDPSVMSPEQANYKIDSNSIPWSEVKDPDYGSIEHLMMVGDDGVPRFDKINVVWNTGVFVTTVRIPREGEPEILLIDEERPLVRNPQTGERGHELVTSIPQGLPRNGQTMEEAAVVRVKRETGYDPDSLKLIGEVYLDAANSETAHVFYLAIVPLGQEAIATDPFETEVITNKRWLKLSEIDQMDPPLSCAKALAGIQLSRRHLPGLIEERRSQLSTL